MNNLPQNADINIPAANNFKKVTDQQISNHILTEETKAMEEPLYSSKFSSMVTSAKKPRPNIKAKFKNEPIFKGNI